MKPTAQSLNQAQQRLAGLVHHTPLLTSQGLSQMAGAELRFKAENLQRTGSFKIRGALNKVSALAAEGVPGVVTASSGNHAQAVAWAARHFGIPCRVVVPTTTPRAKSDAARSYGAAIEFCGTVSRERLARAQTIAAESGYGFVPPYDDVLVMSGQGTIGRELLADWPECDSVLVPIGGGGLIAGVASAIKLQSPATRVIGVEPAGAAKATAARQSGHLQELPAATSIADGLLALSLGALTFPVIEEHVDEIVTVDDHQIAEAWWLLASRLKLITEPSGACAAAYALTAPFPLAGRRVAIVLSGGNLDAAVAHTLTVPNA
ncbi:MAG: threonine/serine dehydratase [Thermaerobacter sp.]|nr:threonine/serine dehydratase [Thermaerobacter sp.]